ncbi:MAG TPA: YbaB/EbfC family nucleoid-associated protein [Chloroflexota bacterium]|nr:YbaB/EbfC family nucleoid-associated protein [Chloroflexota bacterium]
MLKQVQDMQANMLKAQEELAQTNVEGSAGGGMVTARLNGKQELESITLDRDVVDPDDIEMLQDLIVAAVNDAQRKLQEITQEKMGAVTGGLQIPGLT